MPTIKVNGVSLHYEEHGTAGETVVFVHGLLMNHRMFNAQIETLKTRYRCIAIDLRGQGASEVTRSGYDMDNLATDIVALIEAMGCGPCHFVGLSMGGFIGLRLAIHYPQLIRTLTLLDSSADAEAGENLLKYRLMACTGRVFGFRPLIGQLFPILFGRNFLADEAQKETRDYWKQQLINNKRTGTSRAAMGVIERESVYQQLGEISTPTLIVVGDQDVATRVEKSRRMFEAIDNSELLIIPGAGHSSSIEKPGEVNQALQAFLSVHTQT